MKIREKIFETNSSSTHSCVIRSGDKSMYETLPVNNQTGVVQIQYGEFGWEYETYTRASCKASYAATLLMSKFVRYSGEKDPQFDEYQSMLTKVILDQTQAKSVEYDNTNSTWHETGYVDHQSVDEMFAEIFASEESLRDFIFHPYSELTTDNDNH